jgi:hypothetical protein
VQLHEIFSAYCIVNTGIDSLPVYRYMDLMRDLCKRYLNMMEDSQENEVMIVFMMNSTVSGAGTPCWQNTVELAPALFLFQKV